MKLISANKLNRLWNNGVVAKMVAKTKILKTLEEIEANTNVENVAGATALKEVNNKLMFPDGTGFYLDEKNGERGYNTSATRGADTFVPFFNNIRILAAEAIVAGGEKTYSYVADRKCKIVCHLNCSGYSSTNASIQASINGEYFCNKSFSSGAGGGESGSYIKNMEPGDTLNMRVYSSSYHGCGTLFLAIVE